VLREPVGDGGHEAYTAIVWGGILSLEKSKITEAETVSRVEGNMCCEFRSIVITDSV
jgi:hypothetical protein